MRPALFYMIATNFKQSNGVLGPPKGQTEDEVHSLCVFQDGQQVISCWKPTQEELAEIQRTGRVWLHVSGVTMPPVYVSGEFPFIEEADD